MSGSVRKLVGIAAGLGVLLAPAIVSAHIDPVPKEAQAGSVVTVGFTVEHGCAGSPTVALDMRLPEGVVDASAVSPTGWAGEVAENIVTFTGGPLPDDEELEFEVSMTLPPTPDVTIYFPFVQRCEVGEIRWIDVPTDGSGDDLDEPAPAMTLVGPVAAPVTTVPATTTTTAPATTEAPETDTDPTTAATTSTPATTEPPVSTAAPFETAAPDATTPVTTVASPEVDRESDGGGGSSWPLLVLGGAVLAAGAAAVIGLRRR
ncbi:MAG: DUF1775 domain-containing protein [Actinomycetota bacterium]